MSSESLSTYEMCRITYQDLADTVDFDELAYQTYSPYFPELEKGMSYLEIQDTVNKKPYLRAMALRRFQRSLN